MRCVLKAVVLVAVCLAGVSALDAGVNIAAILKSMTLEQKIAQMIQSERMDATPDDVSTYCLGSMFSGGGSFPGKSTMDEWFAMTQAYAAAAMRCPLKIPLVYGVDAVHGHSNVQGATIYPHNIGLGASRSPQAVADGAYVTAHEMAATGVNFAFAPCVAVSRDTRWGRAYESFGELPEVAMLLAGPYVNGLRNASTLAANHTFPILGSVKHFVGDGATKFGTSPNPNYMIDQGDAQVTEDELRKIHLPGFIEAIKAGIQTVMISYSSWNGAKLHSNSYLINDVLKAELGFQGFTISDYNGAQFLNSDPYPYKIAAAVNAGVDMHMVTDFRAFLFSARDAVNSGLIPIARIDDAVSRILRVKANMGLFQRPLPVRDPTLQAAFGGAGHRALARRAVQQSLVLLKNWKNDRKNPFVLPLKPTTPLVLTGSNADDVGGQCGGWTVTWQGGRGRTISNATSIREGIESYAKAGVRYYSISQRAPPAASPDEVAVIVMGEAPYAEGFGDRTADQLTLAAASTMRSRIWTISDSRALLDLAAAAPSRPIVCVLVSGRPLVLADSELNACSALVAAWLPGSEGAGVADVLYGAVDFQGRLPMSWPATTAQIPFFDGHDDSAPLFPFGFGLSYRQRTA